LDVAEQVTIQWHEFWTIAWKTVLVTSVNAIVVLPFNLNDAVKPGSVRLLCGGTLKALDVINRFFLPEDFQMVVVKHPGVGSIRVFENTVAVCNEMVDELVHRPDPIHLRRLPKLFLPLVRKTLLVWIRALESLFFCSLRYFISTLTILFQTL
jgi:hypothetical protein